MKAKHFDKKLSLQKTTVSNLDQILGGNEPNIVAQKATVTLINTCNCTVSRCWTQCPSIGAICAAC